MQSTKLFQTDEANRKAEFLFTWTSDLFCKFKVGEKNLQSCLPTPIIDWTERRKQIEQSRILKFLLQMRKSYSINAVPSILLYN